MSERTIGHKIYEAVGWLDMCQNAVIYGAFSGGNDSVVACDILYRWCFHNGREFRVMCIETGLQSDSWRSDVKAICERQWGTTPDFYQGKGWEWYADNVLSYGFGYTPGHHTTYYRMLKQEAIRAAVREAKRGKHDRVAFVTGVRRDESHRRAQTPYYTRIGCRVSLNIICEFTADEVQRYITALLPDHRIQQRSRDCHCNWTRRDTVASLREHSPILASKISALEQRALAQGLWCYGGHPNEVQAVTYDMPDDSWCISCQATS